jgi:cysteine desulfurase / selenocysteine lyase
MENTAFTQQEIQQFRAETRGTAGRIHFNNAGSSLPPDVVVERVIDYLKEEATNGGYETEFRHTDELENTYALIAKLINADVDEVAVMENASTGWSTLFNGIPFKKGDEVITSEMEYVTNLLGFITARKMHGIEFKVVPNDEEGNFSLSALEAAITPQTKLIAITHIASGSGSMIPVAEIGKIARKHNVLYLVDACQSVGHVPIDVKAIDCDMLSVTGRKYLRAPRGTGFLYVRKEVQDKLTPFFIDGHAIQSLSEDDFKVRDDARRFELYEKSRALMLGLGKAVEYALNIGIDRIFQRIQYLSGSLREQLKNIEGVTVYDKGKEQCGIVTFALDKIDSASLKGKLAEYHINVSLAVAQSTFIYMERNHLKPLVRASVHYYNTEEELKTLCDILSGL